MVPAVGWLNKTVGMFSYFKCASFFSPKSLSLSLLPAAIATGVNSYFPTISPSAKISFISVSWNLSTWTMPELANLIPVVSTSMVSVFGVLPIAKITSSNWNLACSVFITFESPLDVISLILEFSIIFTPESSKNFFIW